MNYYNIGNLPKRNDCIALDTQIVYWVFYASDAYALSDKRPYQIDKYAEYIKELYKNENKLVVFGGVLLELFKIIEQNEYKLYIDVNCISQENLSLKEYRKNTAERELVKKKLDIVYKQIDNMAYIQYDFLEKSLCEDFIESFTDHKADFVDFSLLYFCKKEGIHNILTDDADFKTLSGDLNIFSANGRCWKKSQTEIQCE